LEERLARLEATLGLAVKVPADALRKENHASSTSVAAS
jgi:hypothetical protein